jgi:hypothetical protein
MPGSKHLWKTETEILLLNHKTSLPSAAAVVLSLPPPQKKSNSHISKKVSTHNRKMYVPLLFLYIFSPYAMIGQKQIITPINSILKLELHSFWENTCITVRIVFLSRMRGSIFYASDRIAFFLERSICSTQLQREWQNCITVRIVLQSVNKSIYRLILIRSGPHNSKFKQQKRTNGVIATNTANACARMLTSKEQCNQTIRVRVKPAGRCT